MMSHHSDHTPWTVLQDESLRHREFPVTERHTFLAHAAVAALPRVAVDAMQEFAVRGSEDTQENAWAFRQLQRAREAAATLIGAHADEIALLGPTSFGLNLVAMGLPWRPGDEVVYYPDDYPANVYPWKGLEGRGVTPVAIRTEHTGHITWPHIERAISTRTRLVALASCHFLSGYRIDVERIGSELKARGILFSLDGIQTLGAFPLSVEHVDFLSADSHKWMLGPVGAGIFYVKRSRMDLLAPTLLGALNVVSPEYVAQDEIRFYSGARRYEPGSLNLPGIVGMLASIELLLAAGLDAVSGRIIALRTMLLDQVRPLGYQLCIEALDRASDTTDAERSGIVSVTHPDRDMREISRRLRENGVGASLRYRRDGRAYLRLSPHFYNTYEEMERVARLMA